MIIGDVIASSSTIPTTPEPPKKPASLEFIVNLIHNNIHEEQYMEPKFQKTMQSYVKGWGKSSASKFPGCRQLIYRIIQIFKFFICRSDKQLLIRTIIRSKFYPGGIHKLSDKLKMFDDHLQDYKKRQYNMTRKEWNGGKKAFRKLRSNYVSKLLKLYVSTTFKTGPEEKITADFKLAYAKIEGEACTVYEKMNAAPLMAKIQMDYNEGCQSPTGL